MAEKKVVTQISTPKLQREGGGFLVRKVIGGIIPSCDPFLMLDHIGPVDNKPGESVGAPDHPHRGFETVTYVIDGGIKHKDSEGNKGNLKEGWVQWMTAGRGIVHAEMPTDEIMENGGRMEGFQLWTNLPAKHKMIAPRYQEMKPEEMASVENEENKYTVKIISGTVNGVSSKINTLVPITFLDIHLQPGGQFTHDIPPGFNSIAYVWRGSGVLGSMPAHMGQVGLLSEKGTAFTMKATDQDCHILLIAGEIINEPIVKYGPFVMNTQAEIDQAVADYQAGLLGSIPGKEERLQQTEIALARQRESGTWT
ncbi:unnamed protein product [Owenia fusiformis]|uniref:Uncharacterized protein n=1 Tax=Owenia fusiformis TaxID=6347 RepID=A0A8J1Y126_OWEFU|nr:unnamed protein product [Owenia fusiformis]